MIEETGGVVMKKQNLFTKFRKWLRHIRTETNYFTYGTSLLLFVGISFFSLGFEGKPFTVLSSLGCGGTSSVIFAIVIEMSNNRIAKYRNEKQ